MTLLADFTPRTVPMLDATTGRWVRHPLGPHARWMSERPTFQAHVERLTAVYGAVCFHERSSRLQKVKGWPDCVIITNQAVIWRELKSARGRLSRQQQRIGRLLLHAGQDWAVWTPDDLINGTIEFTIAQLMEET